MTQAHYLARATALLERAREHAKQAQTPGLLAKIRSALKSAGGAERNLHGRPGGYAAVNSARRTEDYHARH